MSDIGDLRPSREELEEATKSFAETERKLEAIMVHAADPKNPRRKIFAAAAEAYTKTSQAKFALLDVYREIGVRSSGTA